MSEWEKVELVTNNFALVLWSLAILMFCRICRLNLFACSQKVLPFSRISTLDLWSLATEGTQEFGWEKKKGICNSHRWKNRSLATEGTQEFLSLKKYQFLHVPIFVAMRQCELQTRVYLLLPNCKFGRTKEKRSLAAEDARISQQRWCPYFCTPFFVLITDAGRRLRSVTVGRNELRHKTPAATSTLKECPNCNS